MFLFLLGLFWVIFATIEDLKTHEVADWLNYSLIVFALVFRFFYSLFGSVGFSFFYDGLIGLGLFFLIGNLFYYSRIFAGGDAKLLMALGAVLPLSYGFLNNIYNLVYFLFIFLVCGSFYGLGVSLTLGIKNWKIVKKEFRKQFGKFKLGVYLSLIIAIFIALIGLFIDNLLFVLAIIVFVLPYLYIYAKSVDECAMVRSVKPLSLEVGDWLYRDVKIGKKIIKATWNGLTKNEISLLIKNGENVYVRYGIPFVPVFLISYISYFIFRVFF